MNRWQLFSLLKKVTRGEIPLGNIASEINNMNDKELKEAVIEFLMAAKRSV